jgi:hypothetical protein
MISLLFNVVGGSCKRKEMIKEKDRDDVKNAIRSEQISTVTGCSQKEIGCKH